jgi:polysaccharide biosynthesis transport protein
MDGLYEQFQIALHQVWRRRWLALAVAWGLCLTGWLAIALIPNQYESRARLYAQMQSILPQQMGISPAERENDLLRVRQTLTSTTNLEKVVRRTDLNLLVASERDLADQVERLRKDIQIIAQPDNMFEIVATSGLASFSNAQNARTAAAIVQNLLDILAEENLAVDRAETGQSLGFLDEELRRREAQLRDAEQRRMEFETRFLGMLPGTGPIDQRLAAARLELSDLDRELASAQSSLAAIRGQMGGIPASISVPGVAGGSASAQIGALEAQLSQARAKGWTDRHPDVVTAKSQIERLRPQARAERRRGGGDGGMLNPALTSLQAMAAEKQVQVAAAQARKDQIQAAMAQLAALRATEPGIVNEQARLDRDYEVLKRQYDELLAGREQVQLRRDMRTKTDAIQFRVIDPPSRPNVPTAPNRPLLLSLILLVAIAGGFGAAFAHGRIQTTFPTQSRLEQVTGLPVLGTVGEIFTAERRAAESQRLKWFAGAGGALAGAYAILMLVEFWQRSTVA